MDSESGSKLGTSAMRLVRRLLKWAARGQLIASISQVISTGLEEEESINGITVGISSSIFPIPPYCLTLFRVRFFS